MTAGVETERDIVTGRAASWAELNQRWLVAAIARLRDRIQSTASDTASGHQEIEDTIEDEERAGFTPALLWCARVFGLTPFERELLLLAAGLELDRGLRAAVRAANGNSAHATYSFALGALTQPHWDALSPQAPLRHWRLVDLEPGVPLTQAALRIDERILHFITGVVSSDARLFGVVHRMPALPAKAVLVDEALIERIERSLRGGDGRSGVVMLYNEPLDPGALRDIAFTSAAALSPTVLWMPARALPAEPAELAEAALRVDREVLLTDAIPVLMLDGTEHEAAAADFADRLGSPLLWLGSPSARVAALAKHRRTVRIEVPAGDTNRARAALVSAWTRSVVRPDAREDLVAALERAAAQFRLGPAALDEVIERLEALDPDDRVDAVWAAAREAARGGLDALAQRIVTRACFGDLVLPATQLGALREIARHLRHRDRVYREWGFGSLHARGQGLTALFSGESGTGKTLAAEAIANEVDLDLYRVDLATVVSKYIGETEKNLKRLFDAAESSGAVLLFDEADALFGKRSEVKDSHDRYANIEVAYLLQRVEAYRGLAILTTNMRAALDRAFLRRIRFVIHFPFPDAVAREQIWRRQFPPDAPVGDIDFRTMAGLNVCGGHINSIAVNAAFTAADRATSIDQPTLIEAARAEFAKLERTFTMPERMR